MVKVYLCFRSSSSLLDTSEKFLQKMEKINSKMTRDLEDYQRRNIKKHTFMKKNTFFFTSLSLKSTPKKSSSLIPNFCQEKFIQKIKFKLQNELE